MNHKAASWVAPLCFVVPFLVMEADALATAGKRWVTYPPHCSSDTQCNDNNACTVDRCQQGLNTDGTQSLRCVHNPVDTDDLNPCTTDSCDPTTGTQHVPLACPAPTSACHTQGSCQVYTWQQQLALGKFVCATPACYWSYWQGPSTYCSTPAAPNGTACNDNNACTQTDTCQGGTCNGSNPVLCTASDPCHAAGSCDTTTGQCSNPAAPDGTACNDNNACTTGDACQGGTCNGSNPCENGGTCSSIGNNYTCTCPAAYEGTICQNVTPVSCAAVQAADPAATDGLYSILVAGNLVTLYCANMATAPAEYLPLANTGGSYNFSSYAPSQTTSYTQVRFHPSTLTVDLADATFATNVGTDVQNFATIPYASAEDCIASGSQAGTANVNLLGTPFALAPNQFVTQGFLPAGSIVYGANNKTVDLTGGGYCGVTTTANYGAMPLSLVYQPG